VAQSRCSERARQCRRRSTAAWQSTTTKERRGVRELPCVCVLS